MEQPETPASQEPSIRLHLSDPANLPPPLTVTWEPLHTQLLPIQADSRIGDAGKIPHKEETRKRSGKQEATPGDNIQMTSTPVLPWCFNSSI